MPCEGARLRSSPPGEQFDNGRSVLRSLARHRALLAMILDGTCVSAGGKPLPLSDGTRARSEWRKVKVDDKRRVIVRREGSGPEQGLPLAPSNMSLSRFSAGNGRGLHAQDVRSRSR